MTTATTCCKENIPTKGEKSSSTMELYLQGYNNSRKKKQVACAHSAREA
jgi:hypothetical protein